MSLRNTLAAASLLVVAACGGGDTERQGAASEAPPAAPDLTVDLARSPASWQIDREASSIRFRATQNDNAFEGSFSRWNVAVALNPEAPDEEGSIEAKIDLTSADAGNRERNEALPEKGWFHTAMHPAAVFNADTIEATGQDAYLANGTLTIKGVTREVALPFTMEIGEDGRAVADGSVVLDRSAFGIGQGEFEDGKWVGLEVEVLLHMEAEPAV